jgi:hypothetical protein
MSLLVRLLTTGRSLVNLKNSAGQYRIRRKNLLPKFGSRKNPFAPPAAPAPVQVELLKSELTPAETAAANLKETVPLPVIAPKAGLAATAPAPAPAAPAAPAATGPKVPGRVARWIEKLNPLAWWSARRPAGKSAVPRFQRPPVQWELSLDRVKVVRNDLSDADVEIVPAKPAAKRQPRTGVRTEASAEIKPETKTETKSELAGVQAG